MKTIRINLKDESGNIRTGYEQYLLANDTEEAVFDYLSWLDDDSVSEDDLDVIIEDTNAVWDEDGELSADDYQNCIILHHTALGTIIEADSFEEVQQAIADDYETVTISLNIGATNGVEPGAECLVIWPGFDTRSQVMATIERRLRNG